MQLSQILPIYVCDWFVDKKLRIDFVEEKSKSRFFATKFENIYISKNLGNKYTNQTTF